MIKKVKILIVASLFIIINNCCFGDEYDIIDDYQGALIRIQNSLGGKIAVQMCKDNGINLVDPETEISLFHIAAVTNQAEDVRRFLEAGVDPDLQYADGTSALHDASAWGYLEVVNVLIEKGANVNFERPMYKSLLGGIPLTYAVAKGHTLVAEALIKAGADLNYKLGGLTLISAFAVASGNIQMIKLLLNYNVDFLAPTYNGILLENYAWSLGLNHVAEFIENLRLKKSAK